MSHITINARGTKIQAPIAILDKSPVLKQWYQTWTNNNENNKSFYVNVHPKTIHKLLDTFTVDIHEYFMMNTKNECMMDGDYCNIIVYVSCLDNVYKLILNIEYDNKFWIETNGLIASPNNISINYDDAQKYFHKAMDKFISPDDYAIVEKAINNKTFWKLYLNGHKHDEKIIHKKDENIKKMILYFMYLIMCYSELKICFNCRLKISEMHNIILCIYRLIYHNN